MKRAEFIKKARREAKRHGLRFELVEERGSHEMWRAGRVRVFLPRHVAELSTGVERDVKVRLERVFGKDWWR